MNLAFYIHSLVVGGAEKLVVDYSVELKRRGYNVSIIVNKRTDSYLERFAINSGIKIFSLFDRGTDTYIDKVLYKTFTITQWPCIRLNKIISELNLDILHIHTSVKYIDKKVIQRVKIVFTFHSNVKRYLHLIGKKEENRLVELARRGAYFVAINKNMTEEIKKIFFTDNVRYIPNGLNLREIKERSKKSGLDNFSFEEDAFIVGHIGRFNKVKNHERIIEIFNEIHKVKKNAILVLVGGDDEGRIEKIRKIVDDNNLSNCVHFLGIRKDAIEILSRFDVLLLPSYSESFSLTLVEAQGLGIRCVASDNLPKEVFCNDNCIKMSLNDDNEKWRDAALGGESQDWGNSIEDFSMEKVVDDMIVLYDEVLVG